MKLSEAIKICVDNGYTVTGPPQDYSEANGTYVKLRPEDQVIDRFNEVAEPSATQRTELDVYMQYYNDLICSCDMPSPPDLSDLPNPWAYVQEPIHTKTPHHRRKQGPA